MEPKRRPSSTDHRSQFSAEDLGGEQSEGGERGFCAEGNNESSALVQSNAESTGDYDNQR